MNQKRLAIIAVLLSALMWALEPIYAKLSYTADATFLQTSIVRAYIVTIIAGLYILVSKKTATIHVTKHQLSFLSYIAIAGTIGADLIYFYALQTTPVLNAVLLGHLQPLFIILIAALCIKQETLTHTEYMGIIFLMLSAFFVSTKTIDNALSLSFGTMGDLLVLLATLLWATTALTMRYSLTSLHAGTITFYRFFLASIVFTLFIPFIPFTTITIYQIAVGVIVGIGTICYYEGLRRLKAAEVSGIELTAPVFAAIIGFLILHESISSLQIIGILSLFIGVFLITRYSRSEPLRPARIRRKNT